jgi:Mrp family chromosome partitioning ATPase
MGELLAEARRHYDYVVLDTPPLIPFPDCRLLGRWVDGFFIIVAAHQTSRRLVEEALQVVDPAQLLGLVFNRDDRPLSRYGSNGSSGLFPKGNQDEQRQAVKNRGRHFLRRSLFRSRRNRTQSMESN